MAGVTLLGGGNNGEKKEMVRTLTLPLDGDLPALLHVILAGDDVAGGLRDVHLHGLARGLHTGR